MLGDAKGGWVNYRCSQLRAKKSGQRDASATANVVVLILPKKSWIESGYVRHETKFKITGSHLVRWVKAEGAHARGGECDEASAPSGCGTLIRGTPFGGCFALPRAERAVERIRILVTDEKCRFSDFDRRIAEVLSDQFMAGFIEKLPEGGSFVGNAALEGALAHAQLFGDHEEVGPTSGQQALQNPLHLSKDAMLRSLLLQFLFELWREHLQ